MIPMVKPYYSPGTAAAIAKYASSGAWLTEHKITDQLEQALAIFLGVEHCVMVPNGTMALYAALVAAGVGAGDEVIVPDLTMVATAHAVLMAGARPILCDVTPWDLCLDMQRAMALCTQRTKALIFVDLNGRAPRMVQAFRFFHDDLGLTVIEDACQAFGSVSDGRCCGTLGDLGCFSFSPHKLLSMGQGGAVVTDDDDLAFRLRRFKNFGRDAGGTDDHKAYGVNLKYTDLQATVGVAQLGDLAWRIVEKAQTGAFYRDNLEGVIAIKEFAEDAIPWHFDVYTRHRDHLAAWLEADGIATRKMYPALHTLPPYCDEDHGRFPVSAEASRTGLFLPSFLTMTPTEGRAVVDSIKQWNNGKGEQA